jgi:hypothetical protein
MSSIDLTWVTDEGDYAIAVVGCRAWISSIHAGYFGENADEINRISITIEALALAAALLHRECMTGQRGRVPAEPDLRKVHAQLVRGIAQSALRLSRNLLRQELSHLAPVVGAHVVVDAIRMAIAELFPTLPALEVFDLEFGERAQWLKPRER